ncbi:MAG: peptidylprolyl isomerase [Bryobacterales bacterium]|nr:peptidylprolyl isomerase [Bryobacterales bacterium]
MFAQTPQAVPQATEEQAKGRRNGLYAVLNTSMGAITVQLYERESPETVRSFVGLAMGTKPWRDPKTGQTRQTPLYNGTIFHRVIPNFMIQGGDPLGTGTGDGGFTIPDEWDRSSLEFNTPGKLAMANAGPKSTSTQFFITEVPTTYLNGKHTIFGQVVDGQSLVGKIARVPRDPNDKPRTPVVLQNIVVFRVGPEPGTKK